MGHPNYRPILEVADALRLPLLLHVGGFSGTHLATGYPTYHLEHHSLYTQVYAVQVTSLVYGGFDRSPNLQVVLAEGGSAWLPSLLWRLDRAWESMREHAPHLERRPSTVVREHFWLTTQPFDEPEEPLQVLELLEQLDLSDRLLFSSDYPHWDFDDPERVLPASLVGKELRDRVFTRNALACFDFERS
jgi:predicted TIM-barrel fold metal-dependent hydrolase